MKILIINGPNLNLLGTREPEIYGHETLDEIIGELREKFPRITLYHFQSNHEGALIDKLHEAGFSFNGIILNAGGYTHTSIALLDAIKAISTPVIEVHISDLEKREAFRQKSIIRPAVAHHIIGHGTAGYQMAIEYILANN